MRSVIKAQCDGLCGPSVADADRHGARRPGALNERGNTRRRRGPHDRPARMRHDGIAHRMWQPVC